MNHARRLANGDWTGADSDAEEDIEVQEEGDKAQDEPEEEGMELERRKLPKHYANQVRIRTTDTGLCIVLNSVIL